MAWRMVQQPNGNFARWSDVVDDFTHFDMTETRAWQLCVELAGIDVADQKMLMAKRCPNRFNDCLHDITIMHGKRVAEERRVQLDTPRPSQQKHVRWVNVYPDKLKSHLSRKVADEWREDNCIACIKVEFTEGEGLP